MIQQQQSSCLAYTRSCISMISLTGAFLLIGCSTGPDRPRFYPNDTYRTEGSARAEQAASECMALADQYSESGMNWEEAAKSGLGGAAIGAGTGALGGVITKGSVGRTTAAGAAIGGLIGVASEARNIGKHSPGYERFVERCLQKQGYEVVGWGK